MYMLFQTLTHTQPIFPYLEASLGQCPLYNYFVLCILFPKGQGRFLNLGTLGAEPTLSWGYIGEPKQ